MKHLDSSIIKLQKFVNKIKNSQLLIDDLKSICKIKNVKFLIPIQDVDIRWNATYQMIERQISIRDIMEILVNSHSNTLKIYIQQILNGQKFWYILLFLIFF